MLNFVYEQQTGKLLNSLGVEVGYINKNKNSPYRRVSYNGRDYGVHRIIWEMHYGKIPKGYVIDHIDGNGLNNKLENLRVCTPQQNAQNRQLNKNNQYGYKGVTKAKGRKGSILKNPWRVWIQHNKKYYTKHGFRTAKEAARHYNEKAIEFFGEYANLNKV